MREVRHKRAFGIIGVLGAVTLTLSSCGSQGYAAPLGKITHAALRTPGTSQQVGEATLTPMYATHIQPFYQGKAISWQDPTTPAEVRGGGCDGPVLAGLTSNAEPAEKPVAITQASNGGVLVAIAQTTSLYVVVLDHPGATGKVIACGYPLSQRRQFIRLVPPDQNADAIALGTALTEELPATALSIAIPGQQALDWSVHNGTCLGPQIASGHMSPSDASPVVFASAGQSNWWIVVQSPSGTACGQATP